MAFPTSGIIAYWKLDETGTGNASDATGNGYTLTNNGPFTYATAKINNGFDGGAANVSKSASTASELGMDMSTNYTVNFWVNITTAPSGSTDLFSIGFNGTANKKGYIQLQYYAYLGYELGYIRNDSNGQEFLGFGTANNLGTGTWHMLTAMWNGSNMNLYLDANHTPILTGVSTRTGTNTGTGYQGLVIADDGVNSRFSSSYIDEFGIWNRAIALSEMDDLYNGGTGLQYSTASVINSNFFAFI